MRILGIDPGSRHTGVIIRDEGTLLFHQVIHAHKDEDIQGYVARCLSLYRALMRQGSAPAFGVGETYLIGNEIDGVVFEGLNPPRAVIRMTNPVPIIETAYHVGAIAAWCQVERLEHALVPPGKHGSQVMASYPEELRGPKSGNLRHARSAWDVSHAWHHLQVWSAAKRRQESDSSS